jgi:hypothetical protein
MDFKIAVFPNKFRFIGFALMLLAMPFAYLYFLGGKPEFFNLKTFALITTYSETRYFVLSQTNILDELAAILFIIGIVFVSFSELRNELPQYEMLRMKALRDALFTTIIFWLISFLLVYGIAIFIFSMLIFILFLCIYNVLFIYALRKNRT